MTTGTIDAPIANGRIDPPRFPIRGWVWCGEEHSRIGAIEVWQRGACVGRGTALTLRPDVCAALGLPPTTCTGFELWGSMAEQASGDEYELELRVRWADGSLSLPVARTAVQAFALGLAETPRIDRTMPPTHEARVRQWLPRRTDGRKDFGIEIGAFLSPVPGINPLYIDRFPSFDYQAVRADYLADAGALPLRDHALDYVVHSNVLEHLPNPVQALWEWARVVRDGGILYMVIPDRRLTFDHRRPLTAPEHLMEDFRRGTTDCDPTHIADYIDGVDWSRWAPEATPEERVATREKLRAAYLTAVAGGGPINIHFHTFELTSFVALLQLMNAQEDRPCRLELVDALEYFPESHPSSFLVVLRVSKSRAARLWGRWRRFWARGDVRATLLPGAPTFPKPVGPQGMSAAGESPSPRSMQRKD